MVVYGITQVSAFTNFLGFVCLCNKIISHLFSLLLKLNHIT